MKITVTPYMEFINNADKYTKILSITEPERKIEKIGQHHCILEMYDVDEVEIDPTGSYAPPSKTECFKAIKFAKTWKENDNVLIHCLAGISRSPAIAFGIVWYLTKNKKETLKILEHTENTRIPNMAIMRIWAEIFDDFPFYTADNTQI
ncbi:MAG: hypothetical protein FWF00_05975 [Endomicrobia bacterium]|nr:hypothetical protein [Endomicrobiia bacterium]MCL2507213.1 hypothetical protein [Endomicrobiia bacterium]